jgi:hypothetical protein
LRRATRAGSTPTDDDATSFDTSIAWYGTLWPTKLTVCVQLPVSSVTSAESVVSWNAGRPWTSAASWSTRWRPPTIESSVDLPAPFAPTSMHRAPRGSCIVTDWSCSFFTTCVPMSYCLRGASTLQPPSRSDFGCCALSISFAVAPMFSATSYENQRSLHSTAVAESCIGTSADIAGCVFERGLSGFLLRASTSMHEKSPKSCMGHSSTHLAWMDFFSVVYSPNTPPGTTLFHRPSPAAAPQHRGADPLPIRRVFFFTSAALACGRPAASRR